MYVIRTLLAGALLLLLVQPAKGATLEVRVIGVLEGDIIAVVDADNNEYKVRLAGIDAPEPGQPHADESTHSLSELVLGKRVTVDWNKIDRHGRAVGKALIASAQCQIESCPHDRDLGLLQIARGYARHFKQYQHEQSVEDRAAYDQAEESARLNKAGLWGNARPEGNAR